MEKATSMNDYELPYFGIGATAGLIMEALLHPLGVVKTRQKANEKEFVTMRDQTHRIIKNDGYKTFLKGFTCTLAASTLGYGSYFYVYEKLKDYFKRNTSMDSSAPALAASIAGFASDLFYIPCGVIRSRMQLEKNVYDYKHLVDGVRKIYQKEGFRALYKGFNLSIFLDCVDSAIFFGIYEYMMKKLRIKMNLDDNDLNMYPTLFSTFVTSVVTSVLTCPLDVILLRVQIAKGEGKYKESVLSHAKKIYKYEGLSGFMKGYTSRMVVYCSGGMLIIPLYEYLKFNVKGIY